MVAAPAAAAPAVPVVSALRSAAVFAPPVPAPAATVAQINAALFESLNNFDYCPVAREALDAINDFTRKRMREQGFFRKIMPLETIELSFVMDRDNVMTESITYKE